MNKKSQSEDSPEPTVNPRLWKVEPGFGLGVFRLGMSREEVFQVLKEQNFETCEDDLEDSELYVLEMEVTLYFGVQSPYPLLLIEAEDERVRFGTLVVLWDYPHNIFNTIAETDTLWCDDFSLICNPNARAAEVKALSDEELLNSGTLWITSLGVGFNLSRGRIVALYLCDPANLPQTGNGQFTGAQRHLSEKMQLASYKAPVSKAHPLESLFKLGLLIAAVLVAAFFGKQAWDEQQRWNNAPEVEAEVVSVWPPPPEPFPEKYQLSYRDHFGAPHEVELGQNDVYGSPQIGEKVNLRYLMESPQTAKGPSQLHDIGFDKFVPYLLGTVAVYFVLHFLSDWLIGLLRYKLSNSKPR